MSTQQMTDQGDLAGRNEAQSLTAKFVMALSWREQRLVYEMAKGEWHKTRALENAGYSKSTALKQQARVFDRPRVQQALIAIRYEQEGSERLTNDELRMIGVNVRSARQHQRRKLESESRAEAKRKVAQLFARRR